MADLSDVENALATLIAGALFPSGGYHAGAYTQSAAGCTTKLYRGWPESKNLNDDMLAGHAHVTVYSDPGMTRDVSRWPAIPTQVATVTPTLTATLAGQALTIGGTVTAGNVVGLEAGPPMTAYAYIAQAGDTLATVATALAAKVPGASATGAVITLPTKSSMRAAYMVPQPTLTVTRQQIQGFRISVWAPNPAVRDAVVSLVDSAISGNKNANGVLSKFIAITPYERARIQYHSTYSNDMPARDRIWRRDLCYSVEYTTSLLEQDPIMLFGGGTETIGVTGTTRQFGDIAPT